MAYQATRGGSNTLLGSNYRTKGENIHEGSRNDRHHRVLKNAVRAAREGEDESVCSNADSEQSWSLIDEGMVREALRDMGFDDRRILGESWSTSEDDGEHSSQYVDVHQPPAQPPSQPTGEKLRSVSSTLGGKSAVENPQDRWKDEELDQDYHRNGREEPDFVPSSTPLFEELEIEGRPLRRGVELMARGTVSSTLPRASTTVHPGPGAAFLYGAEEEQETLKEVFPYPSHAEQPPARPSAAVLQEREANDEKRNRNYLSRLSKVQHLLRDWEGAYQTLTTPPKANEEDPGHEFPGGQVQYRVLDPHRQTEEAGGYRSPTSSSWPPRGTPIPHVPGQGLKRGEIRHQNLLNPSRRGVPEPIIEYTVRGRTDGSRQHTEEACFKREKWREAARGGTRQSSFCSAGITPAASGVLAATSSYRQAGEPYGCRSVSARVGKSSTKEQERWRESRKQYTPVADGQIHSPRLGLRTDVPRTTSRGHVSGGTGGDGFSLPPKRQTDRVLLAQYYTRMWKREEKRIITSERNAVWNTRCALQVQR